MKPDVTLHRYRIDEFRSSSKSSRNVQFEQFEEDTYKKSAKLSAFATSETRIVHWVSSFYHRYFIELATKECFSTAWEEFANTTYEDKCDKIIISIHYKKQKLLTLTIFLTTGRIQVQGLYHNYWVEQEFPTILESIETLYKQDVAALDINPAVLKEICSRNLNNFIQFFMIDKVVEEDIVHPSISLPIPVISVEPPEPTTQVEVATPGEIASTTEAYSSTNPAENSEQPETERNKHSTSNAESEHNSNPNPLSPARLNNITAMKEVVADLESQFIEFKCSSETLTNNLEQYQTEITHLRDKQKQTENWVKSLISSYDTQIGDLLTTTNKMNEQIEKILSGNKKLTEQKTSMKVKQNQLLEEMEVLKAQNAQLTDTVKQLEERLENSSDTSSIFIDEDEQSVSESVKCSNRFEVLEIEQNRTPSISKDNRPSLTTPSQTQQIADPPADSTLHHSNDSSPKYPEQQTTHNKSTPEASIQLLCDSNAKYLDLTQLSPHQKAVSTKCYFISQAQKLIETFSTKPEIMIIHTGTNDLETSTPAKVAEDTVNLLKIASIKMPDTKILYSTLLPRNDELNIHISSINREINKRCVSLPNVHIIDNSDINQHLLYDKKHLNRKGVKYFANNLKSAIFGTPNRKRDRQRNSGFNPNQELPVQPPPRPQTSTLSQPLQQTHGINWNYNPVEQQRNYLQLPRPYLNAFNSHQVPQPLQHHRISEWNSTPRNHPPRNQYQPSNSYLPDLNSVTEFPMLPTTTLQPPRPTLLPQQVNKIMERRPPTETNARQTEQPKELNDNRKANELSELIIKLIHKLVN